jgi:hypothetical protein
MGEFRGLVNQSPPNYVLRSLRTDLRQLEAEEWSVPKYHPEATYRPMDLRMKRVHRPSYGIGRRRNRRALMRTAVVYLTHASLYERRLRTRERRRWRRLGGSGATVEPAKLIAA